MEFTDQNLCCCIPLAGDCSSCLAYPYLVTAEAMSWRGYFPSVDISGCHAKPFKGISSVTVPAVTREPRRKNRAMLRRCYAAENSDAGAPLATSYPPIFTARNGKTNGSAGTSRDSDSIKRSKEGIRAVCGMDCRDVVFSPLAGAGVSAIHFANRWAEIIGPRRRGVVREWGRRARATMTDRVEHLLVSGILLTKATIC